MEELFDKINLIGLENKVQKLTGQYVKLRKELKLGRNAKFFVNLVSDELINSVGILASSLESVRIEGHGDLMDIEGYPTFIVRLQFRYKHKSGGSNGLELLTAWYNFEETNAWQFRTV